MVIVSFFMVVTPASAVETNVELRKMKQQEYKEKVSEMKDARKKALVEKFAKELESLKQRRYLQLQANLTLINKALAKAELAVAEARSKGLDVSGLEEKLASAKAAVQDAQTAVESLKSLDLTPTISSETNVSSDLQKVKSKYMAEVESVLAKVKSAREAVNKLVYGLKEVRNAKIKE